MDVEELFFFLLCNISELSCPLQCPPNSFALAKFVTSFFVILLLHLISIPAYDMLQLL